MLVTFTFITEDHFPIILIINKPILTSYRFHRINKPRNIHTCIYFLWSCCQQRWAFLAGRSTHTQLYDLCTLVRSLVRLAVQKKATRLQSKIKNSMNEMGSNKYKTVCNLKTEALFFYQTGVLSRPSRKSEDLDSLLK